MTISFQGALRTCKVDVGWANKIQSDRFENPDLMICPVWNGRDLTGRPVCADSFYTKLEGCNTPLDRVDVENALRPQYMEYVNLDAYGFRSDIYDSNTESCKDKNNMFCYESGIRTSNLDQLSTITGNYGLNPNGAQIYPRCETYPYDLALQQENAVANQMMNMNNNK